MTALPWLGEASAHDPRRVGHKAAALSKLAATASVPPGFCVPGDIPAADLPAAIAGAYHVLSEGHDGIAVAVRSSALDEDGAGASFAGQYETILNVAGALEIADAVARCRASALSPVVQRYRRDRGLLPPNGWIPVLVQRLVPAGASAVAFSVDPVTRALDTIVINANWGLGESIVSGRVTPDGFLVCKRSLAIQVRNIAVKTSMTVAVAGGTASVVVPAAMQNRAALDDAQVVALAGLTRALEAASGNAVDVECAFHDGDLWLLQCRPVTTLVRTP